LVLKKTKKNKKKQIARKQKINKNNQKKRYGEVKRHTY